MQRINASFAVGLNCPVSMELIVVLDTPISSASCVWDSFFSVRASLRLFFNFSSSFIPYKAQADDERMFGHKHMNTNLNLLTASQSYIYIKIASKISAIK